MEYDYQFRSYKKDVVWNRGMTKWQKLSLSFTKIKWLKNWISQKRPYVHECKRAYLLFIPNWFLSNLNWYSTTKSILLNRSADQYFVVFSRWLREFYIDLLEFWCFLLLRSDEQTKLGTNFYNSYPIAIIEFVKILIRIFGLGSWILKMR